MYYLVAFLAGAVVGAIVAFLIVSNNQKKALEMGQRLKDTLGKK
jgi:hypothetical protein